MDSDFESIMALMLVLFGPAALVLTIAMILRSRRGKLRRQRIKKRGSKT